MGDEKDSRADDDEVPDADSWEAAASSPSVAPPPVAATPVPPFVATTPVPSQSPVSVPPRPVSVVPRPTGGGPPPLSRMPPAPSSRGILPGALRSQPPPPPVRHPPAGAPSSAATSATAPTVPGSTTAQTMPGSAVASTVPGSAMAPTEQGPDVFTSAPSSDATLAVRQSVMPRPPATPPPPPVRQPVSLSIGRPGTQAASASATAQLEQRLGSAQLELRKLGSERHSLRSRLRRESDRVHELESALRAEKELRHQASDEYQAAMAGLRARLATLETERSSEVARLSTELLAARSQSARPAADSAAPSLAAGKSPQGLRRIRGIGPAFQRALENVGITRVEQIAAWTPADVSAFAEKLKIRPDRIAKDDWVAQAKLLEPEG